MKLKSAKNRATSLNTLNSPIIVGHNHFLEPMLIPKMQINMARMHVEY